MKYKSLNLSFRNGEEMLLAFASHNSRNEMECKAQAEKMLVDDGKLPKKNSIMFRYNSAYDTLNSLTLCIYNGTDFIAWLTLNF